MTGIVEITAPKLNLQRQRVQHTAQVFQITKRITGEQQMQNKWEVVLEISVVEPENDIPNFFL